MKDKIELKQQLFIFCLNQIKEKERIIQSQLESLQESKNNETKSSMGDKYETGRAMIQIEEGNLMRQKSIILKDKEILLNLDYKKKSLFIKVGSLVFTSQFNYFVSTGLGKITLDKQDFYCISKHSPIGIQLLNKKIEEVIEFNKQKIRIIEIL